MKHFILIPPTCMLFMLLQAAQLKSTETGIIQLLSIQKQFALLAQARPAFQPPLLPAEQQQLRSLFSGVNLEVLVEQHRANIPRTSQDAFNTYMLVNLGKLPNTNVLHYIDKYTGKDKLVTDPIVDMLDQSWLQLNNSPIPKKTLSASQMGVIAAVTEKLENAAKSANILQDIKELMRFIPSSQNAFTDQALTVAEVPHDTLTWIAWYSTNEEKLALVHLQNAINIAWEKVIEAQKPQSGAQGPQEPLGDKVSLIQAMTQQLREKREEPAHNIMQFLEQQHIAWNSRDSLYRTILHIVNLPSDTLKKISEYSKEADQKVLSELKTAIEEIWEKIQPQQ